MTEHSTKETILDAAEQLFSQQGFTATSLRAIIKEAGVNTASIHYHFGSREGLVEAVLERRARLVNQDRIALLDAIESEFPDGPLPVDGVVRAFLGPVIRMFKDPETPDNLPRLMGYAIMESGDELRPIVARVFKGIIERFVPAFMRALPGVPPEEVMWRMHFLLGAMVFTINVPKANKSGDHVSFQFAPTEDAFEELIDFVTAGMKAAIEKPAGKETS